MDIPLSSVFGFTSQRPSEVRPGLFLGGFAALSSAKALGIVDILTVVNDDDDFVGELLQSKGWEEGQPVGGALLPTQRQRVPLYDEPEADLLSQLPACLAFIAASLAASRRVLVHCAAGVSRSASVVTAHVMVTEALDVPAALAAVREKHPAARPNAGFLRQLQAFHVMGCRVEPAHPAFKQLRLEALGRQWHEAGHVDGAAFAPAPESANNAKVLLYRCRRCRRLLASSDNVMPSISAEAPFARKKGRPASPAGQERAETSLFVEPLRWMQGEVSGSVEGKLYCPSCPARLGSFNWAGIQDADGRWVTPAFQLHLSRLDPVPPDPLNLADVRHPRLPAAAQPSVPASIIPAPTAMI